MCNSVRWSGNRDNITTSQPAGGGHYCWSQVSVGNNNNVLVSLLILQALWLGHYQTKLSLATQERGSQMWGDLSLSLQGPDFTGEEAVQQRQPDWRGLWAWQTTPPDPGGETRRWTLSEGKKLLLRHLLNWDFHNISLDIKINSNLNEPVAWFVYFPIACNIV